MHYIGKVGCGTIGVVFAVVVILAFGIASMFNGPAVAPPTNKFDVEVREKDVEVARQRTEQVIADRAPDLEQQKGIADVNQTNAETDQFVQSLAAMDSSRIVDLVIWQAKTWANWQLTGETYDEMIQRHEDNRREQDRKDKAAEIEATEAGWSAFWAPFMWVGCAAVVIAAGLEVWKYGGILGTLAAWEAFFRKR